MSQQHIGQKTMSSNPYEGHQLDRPELPVVFLIDESSSMQGSKIGAVNTAMSEVIAEMKSNNIGGADAAISVAVLKFGSDISWMHPAPIPVENMVWRDINVEGMTRMGAAFEELASKLSKNEFFSGKKLFKAPVVIMMTDGEPNDDWEKGLTKLQQNKFFKHAIKIGIAIGADADEEVIAKFTGTLETVLSAYSVNALKKLIRIVTITSSMVGSQPAANANGQPQDQTQVVGQQIQQIVTADPVFDNPEDNWP